MKAINAERLSASAFVTMNGTKVPPPSGTDLMAGCAFSAVYGIYFHIKDPNQLTPVK